MSIKNVSNAAIVTFPALWAGHPGSFRNHTGHARHFKSICLDIQKHIPLYSLTPKWNPYKVYYLKL